MKIFNKARFQLLKGTRTSKYLAYAVGEIILVVIGILIALTVNDWKQDKTNEKELLGIIDIIKNDLKSDLKEANMIIKESKSSQELIAEILYNPKFKDSIRNCENCRYLLTGTQISDFNSKGYDLLSNYNKDIKTSNIIVDSIMNFHETYGRAEFQIKNKIILDEVVDNMTYLRDNFDWFSEYFIGGICEEDCLNYFESANYINRITYFEALFFDDFLYLIERYKKDLEQILSLLNVEK